MKHCTSLCTCHYQSTLLKLLDFTSDTIRIIHIYAKWSKRVEENLLIEHNIVIIKVETCVHVPGVKGQYSISRVRLWYYYSVST